MFQRQRFAPIAGCKEDYLLGMKEFCINARVIYVKKK